MPALTATEGRFAPIALIAAVLAEYERLGHATLPAPKAAGVNGWRLGGRPGWRGVA
jgi:hypothetical protein